MGEHYTAEKRFEHGATAVAPAVLATPYADRKMVGAPALRFDASINASPSVRTNGYATMRLVSIGKSNMPPSPIVFIPTESVEDNPVQQGGGSLAHLTGGMLVGPSMSVPAVVMVKTVAAESVPCIIQLKDNFLKLLEEAKKLSVGDLGVDLLKGIYQGIKDQIESLFGIIGVAKEMAGAFNDLFDQLMNGEISLDDLLDGLGDMLQNLTQEMLCQYAAQFAAALAGGKAAHELGKLTSEVLLKAVATIGTAGAGGVVSAASTAGKVAKAAEGVGKKLKEAVEAAKKRRLAKKDAKKHESAPHKDEHPDNKGGGKGDDKDRKKNSSEGDDGNGGNCKGCGTARGPGGHRKPVNALMGIKLLQDEELDFVLPASMPVVWQRFYSSDDPRISLLGQGWVMPGHMEIEVKRRNVTVIDGQGRRIPFNALAPGAQTWSPYEQFWLRRGGRQEPIEGVNDDSAAYAAVPAAWLTDENRYFMRMPDGLIGVFSKPSAPVNGGRVQPWPLVAVIDASGHRTQWVFDDAGHATAVLDSVGRVYRFALGPVARTRKRDHCMRIFGVYLAHNPMLADGSAEPLGPDQLLRILRQPLPKPPAAGEADPCWLVRYEYQSGDLTRVIDILGNVVREFAWQNHILVAHRNAAGLLCRYAYDHHTPDGLVTQEWVDDFELRFDYQPQHTTVTDSLGRSTIYHFEGKRRSTTQRWTAFTHADGSTDRFEYNPFGQLLSMRDALGRTTRYELDGLGRPVATIAPDGTATRVTYDGDSSRVTAVSNALGQQTQMFYDERDRLQEQVLPNGAATHYFYDDSRLPDYPTRIRDARGGINVLVWSAAGQLLSKTDCSGNTTTFRYDPLGTMLGSTDALGNIERFDVNAKGQTLAAHFADGSVERFAHDAQGRLIAYRNPLGYDTHWRYNVLDQPTERIDALGHKLRYQYDAAGRLAELHNENNDLYRFAYDVRDRLVQQIGVDERRSEFRHNAAGELIERIEYGSDPQAASVFADTPEFRALFNTGDGCSLPIARHTFFRYDSVGRLATQYNRYLQMGVHAGEGQQANRRRQIVRYQYDALGQLIEARNQSASTQFTWDAVGNLLTETTAQGAEPQALVHTYDLLGNRTATRLPDGRTLQFLHYGSGHLHQINLDGRVISDIERDALHRETQRTQGALQTRREFDALGRVIGEATNRLRGKTAVFERTRNYRYDSAGQLTHITDSRKGTTQYGYDRIGRILDAQHGDGAQERFAFDPASNLIDPSQIQASAANAQPRSTREQEDETWADTVRRSLHDPNFDVLGMQTQALQPRPPGAWAGNRLLVYQDMRFAWDRHGNLAEKRIGKHTRQLFRYDAQMQLVQVRTQRLLHTGNPIEQVVRFEYDALGRRITKHTEAAMPLLRDAHGEITTPATPPAARYTTRFVWEGNRLQQESRSGRQQRTYVWEPDSFIPLARIDDELQKQERLEIAVQALEVRSASIFDDDDEPDFAALKLRMAIPQSMDELQAMGQRAQAFQHALATGQNKSTATTITRILHYHCDHLGTPQELTDEDGKLVWSASYEAWGKVRRLTGKPGPEGADPFTPSQFWHPLTQPGRSDQLPEWVADNTGNLQRWQEVQRTEKPTPGAANDQSVWGELTDQAIRFQGQYFDIETELYYNRFRYYDPAVGRFINQDPIGLRGGQNLYQYVINPTGQIDPMGLSWLDNAKANGHSIPSDMTGTPHGHHIIFKGAYGDPTNKLHLSMRPHLQRSRAVIAKYECNVDDFILNDKSNLMIAPNNAEVHSAANAKKVADQLENWDRLISARVRSGSLSPCKARTLMHAALRTIGQNVFGHYR